MGRILVVDDDTTDRLLLRSLLTQAGHTVIESSRAQDALENATRERPELIIADLVMPEAGGYTLARWLRADEATMRIPLIFYTGVTGDDVRILTAAVGAIAVIPKSTAPARILEIVEDALSSPTVTVKDLSEGDFDREHLRVLNDRLHRQLRELQDANQRLEVLRTELATRNEQQAVVARLGALALHANDAGPLIDDATTAVARVLGAELVGVLAMLPDSRLAVRSVYGWPQEESEGLIFDGGEATHSGYAIATGDAVVVNDFETENRFGIHPRLQQEGVRSGVAVPIPGADHPFGALCVHSTQVRTFSADDVNFLYAVAHIIGEAVIRAKTDETLRYIERFESLGRLAGSVSHDFNNLLSIIIGNVGLIRRFVTDEAVLGFVDEIRIACDRATALTRQLLTFSRKSDEAKERFDVAETLRAMEGLVARAAGPEVRVMLDVDVPAADVDGDRSLLEQIMLNLAVNARDAIKGSGTLTVRASEMDIDDEYVLKHPYVGIRPGPFIAIEVEDSGAGMSVEVQRRAFEPFFTTKPRGVGTGLGLATVYGAATQLRGHVEIDSEEGRGTTVTLLLPIASGEVPVTASGPAASVGGGRTVLVLEDDGGMRRTLCDVLVRSGFRPVPAGSVPEALRVIADATTTIDVLLVDLVLPGASGWSFIERARAQRPEVGVILMSGYAVIGLERPVPGPPITFLRKPFGRDELLGALGEAAESSEAAS